jgi:proline dehydrogenase
MRRSESDLDNMLKIGARVRLVKGAYRETSDVVFPTRAETNRNFSKLSKILFEKGDNFAIATHDPKLIDEAKKLAELSHANFEFQMLKGIQDPLKDELALSRYRVGEYLPYGDRWYAYSKRRITEHPSNILLLLRSFF